MANILHGLQQGSLAVIVEGADILCHHCPHHQDGICNTQDKVQRYNKIVSARCEFQTGQIYSWEELSRRTATRIIYPGKLACVCGDCEWFSLCSGKIK